MIHSINIKDFRLFKDVNIEIGKYITVISGKNALGKSTILGLIGNACELKISEGKPILQKQFRTEFGEIFKSSQKHDLSGSNKCTINFSNKDNLNCIVDSRTCRITWQRKSKTNINKRFRIIPEKFEGGKKVSSSKYNWPVLYLGLSRLFPIGESEEENMSVNNIRLTKEEKEYFIKHYNKILSMNNEEIAIDSIGIGETERKKGVGISTDEYDYLTNSAGQDNIGQIILSVLSFKRLKVDNDNYKGGLLLIDEIDAALHPSAQLRLVEYLIKSCRELDLQVVFTTHSLTILKDLFSKYNNNVSDTINNIELLYITKDNDKIEIIKNLDYTKIENDLRVTSVIDNPQKISIYSEDNEARFIIEKILHKYNYRFQLIKINMGYSNLLQLNKADPKYFSNILFILDGDVSDEDINKYRNPGSDNILKLPGGKSIEGIIFEYIRDLEFEHPLVALLSENGFTKTYIREQWPNDEGNGKPREQFKKWFNDSLTLFESLGVFEHWINDNKATCDEFVAEFIDKYNKIASRILISKIQCLPSGHR